MGHSVVGVEISEKAIKQFFEDNNMTYSEEPVPALPGAKVFKVGYQYISLPHCKRRMDLITDLQTRGSYSGAKQT